MKCLVCNQSYKTEIGLEYGDKYIIDSSGYEIKDKNFLVQVTLTSLVFEEKILICKYCLFTKTKGLKTRIANFIKARI